MKYRHRAHLSAVPKHTGRTGQWAQTSWNLLGMVFIATLLAASIRLSVTGGESDVGTPSGNLNRTEPTGQDR